ncbi:MAG: DNA polymerase I [Candidatus Magasanikbacteria bacterium]|nr:DNA polymerase I [Candidatus Magasanikbacteria bacterium]
MTNKKEKFVIIDGNAIIHRAYHALPPFTTKAGVQVNAVYGFASMLLKVLDTIKPEYLAVSFDVAKKTFRDDLYKEYKVKRVKTDQELYDQIPLVHEVVKAFDIPIYQKAGFEADDVIGTIAKDLSKKWDGQVIISSGDKDLLQLVDENIHVYLIRKGITDVVMFDEKAVKEKFGFAPEMMVDFKSLKGDPSDNIPGVKGIGDKGANELLSKIGNLEKIYEQIDSLEEKGIKPRTVKLLKADKEMAFLSKKLATIVTDVKGLNFKVKDAETQTIDLEEVVALFNGFGFNSLVKRASAMFGDEEKDLPTKSTEKEKREIVKVSVEDVEKIVSKLKKEKEFFCKEILGNEDVLGNKLIGFACGIKNENYFFDFRAFENDQKKTFYSLFSGDNLLFGHNLKQLTKILLVNRIEIKNKLFDLMIASYLTNSSTRAHDLKSIVARELGKEIKENVQTSLFDDGTEVVHEGVEYFFRLYEEYHKFLKEQKNDDLFHKIEMPLIKVLAQIELNGIFVDKEKLNKLAKQINAKLEKTTEKIHKLAGKDFNIASSVQLRDILFKDLALSTAGIKKGKTGYSTASSELNKLRSFHNIIPLIEEFRELSKLKNTYVDALPKIINKNTNRIHTDFNQAVTTTGRLSSSKPNLQNIPTRSEIGREIRTAFSTPSGFELVSADYSQIELRIVASLAKDKKMLEIFNEGKDIHTATAAAINGVSEDEVTKTMRSRAKEVNFGVLYGMGSYGLASRTGISNEQAKEFIKKYFEEFEGVKKYIDETLDSAKKLGYVETFFGRRRYIPELRASNFQVRNSGERMAVNMPIQGTAADMLKLAMIEIDKRLKKNFKLEDVKIVLQVHDELIFEVKSSLVNKVTKVVEEVMQTVQHFDHSTKMLAPLEIHTCHAKNWGELK